MKLRMQAIKWPKRNREDQKKSGRIRAAQKIFKWKFVGLAAAGTVIFAIIFILAFFFAYRKKIYPGIFVNRVSVGNQDVLSVENTLHRHLDRKTPAVLVYDQSSPEKRWEINLAWLDFNYRPDITARKAFNQGREGSVRQRIKTIIKAWRTGLNFNLDFEINDEKAKKWVSEIASQTDQPAVEPQVRIEGEIRVTPGQDGQKLDRAELLRLINDGLGKAEFSPIRLPFKREPVNFGADEATQAQARLKKIVSRPLVFRLQDQRWQLTTEEIIGLVDIRGGFREEQIDFQIAKLARQINSEPQNAFFRFENGRVVEFAPAVDGLSLKEEEVKKMLIASLTEIENGDLFVQTPPHQSAEEIVVNLPVEKTEPEITTEAVNQMGIKELLATGVSNYAGSAASRIHNLTLASNKLNGTLIPPNETFSFNENIGEVSIATGYQSAFVIKEGKTILDDGGGVCQVSTTLFRAVLNTGLPIIERHPHSYRVSYYEQGGFGPGLDATVWIPGVDFKFKNDTAHHLLLQTRVDPARKELVFEFYGTGDGRQVEISKAKYWSQTPPPPDLYIDDPTLAPGTVKQTERAIWGAKISVDWKVTRENEILQDRTFFSNYKAWQAVFLRGPTP